MPKLHKVSVKVGAPIVPPADASTRKRSDLVAISDELMKSLQSLFDEAKANREARTVDATSIDEAAEAAQEGFVRIPFAALGESGEAKLGESALVEGTAQ